MARLAGWEARLKPVVEANLRSKFIWGSRDCVAFAADAVMAVTGGDLLADWRGAYSTRRSALALCKTRGYSSFHSAVADALDRAGLVRCCPKLAGVGAIGITAGGVACVRWSSGFIARTSSGLSPCTAAIAWEYK